MPFKKPVINPTTVLMNASFASGILTGIVGAVAFGLYIQYLENEAKNTPMTLREELEALDAPIEHRIDAMHKELYNLHIINPN